MGKSTFRASSDVALIKYWGKKDEILRLPENGSISLILAGLDTITTVEFQDELQQDDVTIQGESEEGEAGRLIKHLDRIRKMAHLHTRAKVVSTNSFPKGTGLSSSGSGFAALTYAATHAAGLSLTEQEMSILARQGSGTACRCVCGGIVEWRDGDTSDASYSQSLYPANYFEISDVVVVVDDQKKKVSSTEGHSTAQSSPFYSTRLKNIPQKISDLKEALARKDFQQLGEIVEKEALEFHAILLTSTPSLIAWQPGTIEVMSAVQNMRHKGIPAYFTINTGFNIHVLTLPQFKDRVAETLQNLPLVKQILHASVGEKPNGITSHLF